MRAWQLRNQGSLHTESLRLEELPVPEPGAGQLLIKVHICGVCHTDLHIIEGDIHPPYLPITPGHQVVGTVTDLGKGVTHWELGDRVGIPWLHKTCGTCQYCTNGMQNLCEEAQFTGFHVNGGYAEYLLAEADFALRLRDSISDLEAAPLLCAGMVGYRALRLSDLAPGERLGLFGFGASAHLVIQVAHHWDCEVYVFTRSEQHRQHALELGAAWVGGAEDEPPKALDRAIIFAPAGWIVPEALRKLRPGGTLAINAIHMSPIPEMKYEVIYGERTLRTVANATIQDGVDFLALAAEIPVKATVNPYPLEDAHQALLDMKASRINGEAVLQINSD